tara:strand:- start:732 stop:1718 length:987 start_codon:yes stop_codon:yes gene_type:complete
MLSEQGRWKLKARANRHPQARLLLPQRLLFSLRLLFHQTTEALPCSLLRIEVFESNDAQLLSQRFDEGHRLPTLMASTFLLFQAAAVTSLVGMTLGWRGVMTKYSGFYDLPTAWSNVFWGILVGGVYASTSHNFILLPYLEFIADDANAVVNPINLLFVCLATSVAAHLLLRRERVRSGSSHPTSGWALGLAIGAMVGMIHLYRVFEIYDSLLSLKLWVTVAGFAIFAPRTEALICCFHGQLMLQGRRWGAVLRSTFWRCAYLVMFAYAVVDPLAWVFIIPFALLVNRRADEWIWDSIPSESKKRLRKMWARQVREQRESLQQAHESE